MSDINIKTLSETSENLHAIIETMYDIACSEKGRGTRQKQAELNKAQAIENLNKLQSSIPQVE